MVIFPRCELFTFTINRTTEPLLFLFIYYVACQLTRTRDKKTLEIWKTQPLSQR